MFPDPDKLNEVTPTEVLDAASRGHLGLDHRFLHALLDRPDQALPAVREFAKRDRSNDAVDLAPELISFFRYWNAADAIPFLIEYVKEDPEHVPDEAIEAFAAIGKPALEPLLELYETLDESESGEVAFLLVTLHIPDSRILKILKDRLEFDLSDTLILLEIYGDAEAISAIEKAAETLGSSDAELQKDVAETIQTLQTKRSAAKADHGEEVEEFDIWSLYPETDDLPLDLLDEDERTDLLSHPAASVRAATAHSFFNQDLTQDQQKLLLRLAQSDPSIPVRGRAWESLINSTEIPEVVESMLATLRNPSTSVEEKGGLLIGLAPEADRNEVRQAMQELFQQPAGRAKALEAMWRSMHPAFQDQFAKHLSDPDVEVQRGAIWGVGYYGVKTELDNLRRFFENSELRSDALFAYALAMPAEVTRGRIKSILARIEKEAHGLSEMEEELIKAALDERLMLQGKEPIFRDQED